MPARAELDERVAHAVGLVGAGGDDDLGARDLQRVDRGARRGAGDDDGQRHLGGAAHELGVERQPGLGVEDDPARLARDALDARGQLRVVGQRGADADDHGVDLRAPVVREPARVLARDPLGVAGAGRDLAVERHRRLEEHPRPPGARVLAERLVEPPRAGRELAVGDVDRRCPRRAGSRGRGRRPSRSGRRRRRRRGRCRPRGSPPCTAACGRCGSTARARRRASRRAGRRRRRPRSPRARRAARPARRGSPRPAPAPSRTITAPTSGFGLVRPRPPSASSIARARCSWSVAWSVLTCATDDIDSVNQSPTTARPSPVIGISRAEEVRVGAGDDVAERLHPRGGLADPQPAPSRGRSRAGRRRSRWPPGRRGARRRARGPCGSAA